MLLEKLVQDRKQNMLFPNIPLGHKNYFELKAFKKQ